MWGALGAGALGAGSNIFGSIYSAKKAEQAAATQMAFQKEAYQNRYQWQVQDMRKAGLNPALAYSQGAGSAPSGAQPTNFAEGLKDTGSIAYNAYLDTLSKKQSINTAKAQEEKTKEEAQTVRELRPYTIEQTRTSAKANEANADYGNPLKLGGNIVDKITTSAKDNQVVDKTKKFFDKFEQDVQNTAKDSGSWIKNKFNKIKNWWNNDRQSVKDKKNWSNKK